MSEEFSMRPVGRIESCYGEKFGTPRQSGIVSAARGRVIFSEEVPEGASRGLEEFSHVWLVFVFDQVDEGEEKWLVRPPRLGGNEKKGVFATRSPFRPNRIGLSLVKLEEVSESGLVVSGLDLITGTPILDVKPYIPFVEALPDAVGGFATEPPTKMIVEFPDEVRALLTEEERNLLEEVLSVDPRPAYHDDEREYGCLISGWQVRWHVIDGTVKVLSMARD